MDKSEITEIPECQQGQSWHNWRRIGSSDSPAILGVSPYLTRLELYEVKVGLKKIPENPAMAKGKEMEPVIRKMMEDHLGLVLMPKCINSKEHDFLTASLDGRSWDGKIFCELKMNNRDTHALAKKGKLREDHFVQVQHQYVCEPEPDAVCYYGSYWDGDFVVVEVKRDGGIMSQVVEQGKEFWKNLKEGVSPEPTEKDYIAFDDGDTLALASELDMSQSVRKRIEEQAEEMKEKDAKLKLQICEKVGNRNAKIGKYKFKKIIRKGNVDYTKIPQLSDLDLDIYRKEASVSWRLTDK